MKSRKRLKIIQNKVQKHFLKFETILWNAIEEEVQRGDFDFGRRKQTHNGTTVQERDWQKLE